MTSTTTAPTLHQAEQALTRLAEAVDEFRAADLAQSLAASKLPDVVRIVWLRDLYKTGDDVPQAWVVADDAEFDDIDDADHVGTALRRTGTFGGRILSILENSDRPVRSLVVGPIDDVDNPDGKGGYTAHISSVFTPSETAQRLVATALAQQ